MTTTLLYDGLMSQPMELALQCSECVEQPVVHLLVKGASDEKEFRFLTVVLLTCK